MKQKNYLRNVRRSLNMPKDLKDRVMADFSSSVELRLENGQSWESIQDEFGKPKQAARELNEQMAEYTYRKSPWRWGCLALAVFSGLCLAYKGLTGLLLFLFNKAYNAASVGVIGGADGPTAIFVTRSPDAAAYSMLMSGLILVMSLAGFYYLGHMRKK